MTYTLAEIKVAFIKYYNSPLSYSVKLRKELTEDEQNEIEFADFLKFLDKRDEVVNCSLCSHFRYNKGSTGLCRRYPPVYISGNYHSFYPNVSLNDYFAKFNLM